MCGSAWLSHQVLTPRAGARRRCSQGRRVARLPTCLWLGRHMDAYRRIRPGDRAIEAEALPNLRFAEMQVMRLQ